MGAKNTGLIPGVNWQRYRDAKRTLLGNQSHKPTFDEVSSDLSMSIYYVRAYAVTRYSAVFESFVQCWALNMLLTALEKDQPLSLKQIVLASKFSPLEADNIKPKGYVRAPTVLEIFKAFPYVENELTSMPHALKHETNRQALLGPINSNLTAIKAVKFWRDYRNLLIHRGGFASVDFVETHKAFFEDLQKQYGDRQHPFVAFAHVPLPDTIVHGVVATHDHVAEWLNAYLRRESKNKRGSSAQVTESGLRLLAPDFRPLPLLMDGDHRPSRAFVAKYEQAQQNRLANAEWVAARDQG